MENEWYKNKTYNRSADFELIRIYVGQCRRYLGIVMYEISIFKYQ